jgi:nucleoside 2-deoxyribosyltransferase
MKLYTHTFMRGLQENIQDLMEETMPYEKIYVAGRSVSSLDADEQHARVYQEMKNQLIYQKLSFLLPIQREEFRALNALDFHDVIDRTIQAADGIIVILAPDDDSSPIEAALAARHQKPIALMSLGEKPPGRLSAGLPGVVQAIMIDPGKLDYQAASVVDTLVAEIRSRSENQSKILAVPSFLTE